MKKQRHKIYPQPVVTPYDKLPLSERLARKLALLFVFAGVFFWIIKLLFL